MGAIRTHNRHHLRAMRRQVGAATAARAGANLGSKGALTPAGLSAAPGPPLPPPA
jgi:hypothetical protein